MDTQQEIRNLCDDMAKDLDKAFLKQKEHVYIDSDLLYDYRLGAVLGLTRSEQQFAYVVDHMQDYLDAPTLACAKFFPELGLTDEQLDKFITNPEFYQFICAAAPASEFIDNLDKVIKIMNTLNEHAEVKRPLHVTINQRRIPIHPVYKHGIAHRIHEIDPRVIVEFVTYKSWYEVPETLLAIQDFICVYDLIEFLKEGTISQKMISGYPSKLRDCSIAALLQSDQAHPTIEHFSNTKTIMELMCDKFSFFPKTILNGELINHG